MEEKRFVEEYLKDLNATQAYRRAYPEATYHTARSVSSRMLAKHSIRAEVDAALADLRQRCSEDAELSIRELGLIARSRITDLVDFSDPSNPVLKDQREIHPDAWAAVQEVSRTKYGVKIRLHPKQPAIDKQLQRLGLTQEITSLDSLLLGIPEPLRGLVRESLAEALRAGGGSTSDPRGAEPSE